MTLNTFTLLCNHRHHFQNFSLPNKNSFLLNFPPCFCLPSPLSLVNSILLSVSINLLILDTSCKWNHTIFVLLWLISLSIISLRFIHAIACVRISFLFKVGQYCIVCTYHILFIQSSVDGHFKLLPPFG